MSLWFWRLLRWLFAAYFIVIGFVIARHLLVGGAGIVQPNPQSQAFSDALNASRFMNPALIVSYVAGGICLFIPRAIPLGLALLGPSVVIIFLFHLVLTGKLLWGSGWMLAWLLLLWRYRDGFKPLWHYRG